MTDSILNTDPPQVIFRRLRAERPNNIQRAALLVTLLLHGLLFWWGMNSAGFGTPPQGKIEVLRVFLQPMTFPELAAPSRQQRALPPTATPTVAPPLGSPLQTPTIPVASALSPTSTVVSAPEALSIQTAVSVAPLPVAAAAAVPAVPAATGDHSGSASAPVAVPGANAFPGPGPAGVPSVQGVATADGGTVGGGKELYLRTLFAHIEAHKFYPAAARRRQLEGQVRISFTIGPAGGVSDLKVSEGHPQLEEAALQTLRSARPLPLPAGGVTLPFTLSYRMDFRLR